MVTLTDKRCVNQLNLMHRTGRHALFAALQRADSQEAFYNCSDVMSFSGETTTSPPATPSAMRQIGQANAVQDGCQSTIARLTSS
ncbi:hypothetical protein GFK26_15130 [Variovorax paradoxus]|uniref:Chitin-binding type-4 domain-containing protein n=1 Tax=Variovorax paradoxus TaxID=34073 RepID=A0A5Q0M322_VARPD|nr:lytic polysaccharide monooxygenase [Variovorax paradoxus]QFZ83991.1 hypothetical protein GFK26_15130 [Variovorax paradoxus]